MEIDRTVYSHEFSKFIENLLDYFGDDYGKEHIKYLVDFLTEQSEYYKSELEEYE